MKNIKDLIVKEKITVSQKTLLCEWFPDIPHFVDENSYVLLKKGWYDYLVEKDFLIDDIKAQMFIDAFNCFSKTAQKKKSHLLMVDACKNTKAEHPHLRFISKFRIIENLNISKIVIDDSNDTFVWFELNGKEYCAFCVGEKLDKKGNLDTKILCEGKATDLTFKNLYEYLLKLGK